MKAIVCRNYGSPDVLKYEEIGKPTPGDNEVLIKVRAASVNPVDRLFRAPHVLRLMTGLRKVLNGIVLGKVPSLPRENLSRIRSGIHKLGAGEISLDSHDEYIRSLIARIRQAHTINVSQALKLRLQLIDVLKNGSFPKAFKRRYLKQLIRPARPHAPKETCLQCAGS